MKVHYPDQRVATPKPAVPVIILTKNHRTAPLLPVFS